MKNRRIAETVTIPRLGYSQPEIDLLGRLLTHSDLATATSDEDRTAWGLHTTIESLRKGDLAIWVPIIDGDIAGLIWARFMGAKIVTGMWGFIKEKRYGATQALDQVLADIWANWKPKTIMVFVAENNRASYAGAYRSGFRPQGKIRNYMTINGILRDATIMTQEAQNA